MKTPAMAMAVLSASFASLGLAQTASEDQVKHNVALLDEYCSECHNTTDYAGSIAFDVVDAHNLGEEPNVWEAMVRKLRGRMMPPPGAKQPSQESVDALVKWAETGLDTIAAAKPNPGHVGLKRLNRTEYGYAIEDLLGVKVDVAGLLPKDIETEGFDNVAAALQVSPSFLDQYISAAREVARQAVGNAGSPAINTTYRLAEDGQAVHKDGLPLGTRGGTVVQHDFPADGEYSFNIRIGIAHSYNNAGYVDGLDQENKVILTIDGNRIFEGVVGGREELAASDHDQPGTTKIRHDKLSNIRAKIAAGPHAVGVSFVARTLAESDSLLKPLTPGLGTDRLPWITSMEVRGPFDATGVSDTPSRRRIFVCKPATQADETPCATQIIAQLARRAYRRPVTEAEVAVPLRFYTEARTTGDFDRGIEAALTAVLASPKFLYRAEVAPHDAKPGSVYPLSDLELASRLSFFLWSQGPDDELLQIATQGKLQDPVVLEQQVKRMLTDARSESLVTNFANQWLRVSKVHDNDPDPRLFPEFDPTLRPAYLREMELFVDSILRSDRSVVDLLTADHTFLNERLAVHYGISNVRGAQFRRVQLADSNRWGLLGKGAMLMGTSYGNRTTPVLRGAWILENIIGTPPHAPPPGVEALKENTDGVKPTTV
ncbi:MAG: DUF1592 domain-containing protein, partial [Nevskiaceae bacterium]|nr:DUF1592 domain-containing protein [Nevskiaceae bacterium]